MILDALYARLDVFERILPEIAEAAASDVEAQATRDMTTPRGNVPLFKGKPKWSADIPITARASGNVITVSAIDWAMHKAVAQGKPLTWVGVVQRVAREKMVAA